MPQVIAKSLHISDRDKNIKSGASRQGGLVRNGVGAAEVAANDSVGSKYLLCTVPSNARIISLLLSTEGGITGDVGIQESTQDGGKEIDKDFFAAAKAVAAGTKRLDVTHDNNDIANGEKMLFEALGLATDPQKFYDIVITSTAAPGGAGTIRGEVNFVI